MENLDVLVNFFSDQNLLLKIGLVVLTVLYSLFALIVAIQIRNLNKIIDQIDFSPFFNFLSLVHVGATIALLFAVVISL